MLHGKSLDRTISICLHCKRYSLIKENKEEGQQAPRKKKGKRDSWKGEGLTRVLSGAESLKVLPIFMLAVPYYGEEVEEKLQLCDTGQATIQVRYKTPAGAC